MPTPPDRTARVLRGLGAQSVGQAVVLAVTFLVVPVAVGRLGEADYGLWMVAYGALNYLVLSDFGLSATMARELARRIGRGEPPENIRPLLERAFHLVLWLTALFVAVAAAVYLVAGPHASEKWLPVREPFAAMVFAYLLVFPLSVFGHAIIGLGDLRFYWVAKSLHQLVASAVTVILLLGGWGLWGMVGGFVAGHWLLVGLFAGRIFWRFPAYFPRRLAPLRHPETRASLGAGSWYTANALGNALLGGLDLFILAEVLDPAAAAVYALTVRLPGTLATQLSLAVWTLTPSLAEAGAQRSGPDLARILGTLFLGQALFVGLAVAVVAGVNEAFIAVWLPGHAVFGGHLLNAAVLACLVVRQVQAMSAQMLFSLGFNRLGPLTTLADGLLTAALMVALVAWLGPVGAPVAGMIGAACVSLPVNLIALSRTVGVSAGELMGPMGGWFLRLLPILFLSAAVACGLREVEGRWELAAAAALGAALIAAAYAAVMLPIVRRTPLASRLPRLLRSHGSPSWASTSPP